MLPRPPKLATVGLHCVVSPCLPACEQACPTEPKERSEAPTGFIFCGTVVEPFGRQPVEVLKLVISFAAIGDCFWGLLSFRPSCQHPTSDAASSLLACPLVSYVMEEKEGE